MPQLIAAASASEKSVGVAQTAVRGNERTSRTAAASFMSFDVRSLLLTRIPA
jgi:hypothetical protein